MSEPTLRFCLTVPLDELLSLLLPPHPAISASAVSAHVALSSHLALNRRIDSPPRPTVAATISKPDVVGVEKQPTSGYGPAPRFRRGHVGRQVPTVTKAPLGCGFVSIGGDWITPNRPESNDCPIGPPIAAKMVHSFGGGGRNGRRLALQCSGGPKAIASGTQRPA